MPDLDLSIAVADYDRVAPIVTGDVSLAGARLRPQRLAPSEIFYRQLHESAFDIAEMSLSSYIISQQEGWDFVAIPVFPNRRLFHLNTWCREGDDLHPSGLAGAAIGLTEYQVTAAVWTRGVLATDFGLDLSEVSWFVERRRELSHGGETGFTVPDGLSVQHLPDGETLQAGLIGGALDVILPSPYPGMASRLNRTDEQDLETRTDLRPLFGDARGEAHRFVDEHGFLPMNHTVVVRRSLLETYPWLGAAVLEMFEEAKRSALAKLASLRRSHLVLASTYIAEERKLFGVDPYPYGLAANRDALDLLTTFMREQGLVQRKFAVEDLFPASLIDT